jgi:TolB protein
MGGAVTRLRGWLLLVALLGPGGARAQTPTEVRLDISGAGQRIRVHCEPLQPAGDRNARSWSLQADQVLANDLDWSAVFAVSRAWVPGDASNDVQAVIGGKLTVRGDEVRLEGKVSDVPAGRPILAREYRGRLAEWRDLVHRFSDDIVLQFTGEPGVARTRIAFAGKSGGVKELYVMDYDGANRVALTADKSIALSPAFSPDASLILFTSYRGNAGARIFVTRPQGGRPYLVSGRPGLNTSAAYSPDGREIVCSLSMDGNSEIYLLDARGGSPRRLTNHRAIDTSPTWAPTGREIAFTSDRGGSPQVYLMDHEGGNVRRLTYEVDYTDSPAWSPKGDRIAFVARTGGGFDIYTCRADGTDARLAVSGGSNENPRWSPDGRHLVFASNRDGTPGLYVTDLDGRSPRRLETGGVSASSPAWSPRPLDAGTPMNVNRSNSALGGKP